MANGDETTQADASAAEASAHFEDPAADRAAHDEAAEHAARSDAEQDADAADLADAAGQDEPAEAEVDPDPLAEAERQRDEYLDHLRRERAEFENFRRRAARERGEAIDRGAELLVGNLIGVLDNFAYILEAAKDSSDEALSKGAQMVYAELMDVLGKAGLETVPGAGAPFDPTHHEAMLQVDSEEPVDEPTVADVLRPGYRFKDRVLRPASVSVKQ